MRAFRFSVSRKSIQKKMCPPTAYVGIGSNGNFSASKAEINWLKMNPNCDEKIKVKSNFAVTKDLQNSGQIRSLSFNLQYIMINRDKIDDKVDWKNLKKPGIATQTFNDSLPDLLKYFDNTSNSDILPFEPTPETVRHGGYLNIKAAPFEINFVKYNLLPDAKKKSAFRKTTSRKLRMIVVPFFLKHALPGYAYNIEVLPYAALTSGNDIRLELENALRTANLFSEGKRSEEEYKLLFSVSKVSFMEIEHFSDFINLKKSADCLAAALYSHGGVREIDLQNLISDFKSHERFRIFLSKPSKTYSMSSFIKAFVIKNRKKWPTIPEKFLRLL